MSEHTEGLLWIRPDNGTHTIRATNNTIVATAHHGREGLANAARLVAAWNACRGIDDLERGVVAKLDHEQSCIRGNEIRTGLVKKLVDAEARAEAAEALLVVAIRAADLTAANLKGLEVATGEEIEAEDRAVLNDLFNELEAARAAPPVTT